MKQEKFNIKVETDFLRCLEDGKVSKKAYPKAFGKKESNNFITTKKDNDSIFRIITPMCVSVSEVYTKLQEIMNVVMTEIHNTPEVLWPSSIYEGKLVTTNKINVVVDEEYFKELTKVNSTLPKKLDKALDVSKDYFEKNKTLLEGIYGNISLKVSKNSFEISKIRKNYLNKESISEYDLLVLVTLVFACMSKVEAKTLSELKTKLKQITKKYQLKATDAIDSLSNEKNRLEEEAKLTDKKMLKVAMDHLEDGYNMRYGLTKYTKVVAESVCSIKDAISQGIDYKVLNEAKSVVQFTLGSHKEFIIEGNKTDRDNYIFPIITDDKFTSKQIMLEAGLNCPQAVLLEKDMDAEDVDSIVSPFYNKKVVVKPRNTNYGTGITVFSEPATKAQIMNAIEYAFRFDNNLLLEEYAKGMEYRFLVIDGKCLSVAHRRNASVVGDGKSTIKELISQKCKEPWHAMTGSPVKQDEPVVEYLKLQGLTLDSVVPNGKRVTLRSNSNVSTGGESIDYTDTMPAKFKKIAEKAAKAFDAKICGVDIIIEDFKKDKYSIIEINDNPGYSINEWPYEGRGERIGLAVLDLLGFKQK